MRYSINKIDEKYIIGRRYITFFVFILAMFTFVHIEDGGRSGDILHSIYAIILIAMGIIIFNTMKFNADRMSKYLGLICGIAGLVEIAYLALSMEMVIDGEITILIVGSAYLSIIGDILPILAVYFSLKFRKRKNNIVSDILRLIIITCLFVSCTFLMTNLVDLFDIVNTDAFGKTYFIEVVVSIFIIIVSRLIINILKKDDELDEKHEKNYFRRIAIIIALSRMPMLLHPIIKNIYLEDVLSQFIINTAMYYFYKYIIYSNVKKPYLRLNYTSEQLKEKAENLKKNNKKLLLETEVIQNLKENLSLKEEKLKCTLNNSPNSIIVFNESGDITFGNETFEVTFNKNECTNVICFKSKIINYDEFKNNIDDILNRPCSKEGYINTFDNKVYLVRYTPLVIKYKLEGILCILIDKTNIKEFQYELISANERYDSFLELIDDGIIVFEDGKKVYSNNACKKIFDNSIDKLDYKIGNKEEEEIKMDDKEIYVKTNVLEYYKNDKNKTVIAIKDITDKKVSQIKLKKNQESYERFIDILPDGICILDEKLDIYYANKSLLDMTEYINIEDINGKNIKDIISLNEESEREIYVVLRKVFEKNRHVLLIDYDLITKSNKKIEVEANAFPFSVNDKKHIIFILKDLTNKKTSEIAEKELVNILKRDRVKTEFFANMSHELKTPLNVISSSNQLLESFYKSGKIDDYNDNIKYHLELVKQNSYRLQRLINNIIDLTKMDSGYYNLNLDEHNIVMVIEDLIMKVASYANRKNISLIFDTDMEEINMDIDKSQIERVMLNLLSNCIKFTNIGGSISVYVYYKFEEIVIKVKDTGVGIPEDKLDLIFEEFAQADRTLSRNTEGSGIGLAIVKNLVELHGGNIKVKSEINEGTEFNIRLPIKSISSCNKEEDRSIYNIDEKINIEFSDIYY